MADPITEIRKGVRTIGEQFRKLESRLPELLKETDNALESQQRIKELSVRLRAAFDDAMPHLQAFPDELETRAFRAKENLRELQGKVLKVKQRAEEVKEAMQSAPVPSAEADLSAAPPLAARLLGELQLDDNEPAAPSKTPGTLESWALDSGAAATPKPSVVQSAPPPASSGESGRGVWTWANSSAGGVADASRQAPDQQTRSEEELQREFEEWRRSHPGE